MPRHAMTVAELIKDLQQMPPDAPVFIPKEHTATGEGWDITGVYIYKKTGNVGIMTAAPYSTPDTNAVSVVDVPPMNLDDASSVEQVQSEIRKYLEKAATALAPTDIEAAVAEQTGLRERDVHLALMLMIRNEMLETTNELLLKT